MGSCWFWPPAARAGKGATGLDVRVTAARLWYAWLVMVERGLTPAIRTGRANSPVDRSRAGWVESGVYK